MVYLAKQRKVGPLNLYSDIAVTHVVKITMPNNLTELTGKESSAKFCSIRFAYQANLRG